MRDYTHDALQRTTYNKTPEEEQFGEVIRMHVDEKYRDELIIKKNSSDPYGIDLIVLYKSKLLPFKIEVEQGDGWWNQEYPQSAITGRRWRNASFLMRKFEPKDMPFLERTLYVKYNIPQTNCYFMWKSAIWNYYKTHPWARRTGITGERDDVFIDIPWNCTSPKLWMGLKNLGEMVTVAINRCIELE